jgi:hypothetical protein
MLRIGLLIILIIGIFVCIQLITKQQEPVFVHYKITSVKAARTNPDNILASDEYYLMLHFDQDIESHKKRLPLSLKQKTTLLKCNNQIKDIKIFSTEKLNEGHPAGSNLADIFDFHYVRNLETKYGTMIKEGITIPLSGFGNLVDQDVSATQLKELKLHLNQKPIMKSEHQFIVNVLFENGEIRSDTTECINFEGVQSDYRE